MKTTTKIVMAVLAFFILMTSVSAYVPNPYPIAGEISILGDIVPLFEVKLSTCDIGSTIDNCIDDIIVTFQTDSSGHYIFALDEINPVYMVRKCNSKGVCFSGDFVKLKICDNHPNCEVIKEVKGSAMIVDFELGTDKPVEIVREVEKIVEVPIKADDGTDIDIIIADEPTTIERWVSLKSFWWIIGFIAMVLMFMIAHYGRAKKMLATLIKKHNKKGYGK